MSNLSSYSQIFIDNLFGRNEEIYEYLGKNQLDLYNSSLINVEEEFRKNIYAAFITIKYTFDFNMSINTYRDRDNIITSILNLNLLHFVVMLILSVIVIY